MTFESAAEAWLLERCQRRTAAADGARPWGEGSDDVSVFHDLAPEEELAVVRRAQSWQAEKFDAGYGAGLAHDEERIFDELEAQFETPDPHELHTVTRHLIAPTIEALGTPAQQSRFVRPFLRTDELCCQLFSEPGAGSDLASVSTFAARDGDDWVVSGQKVWSSGAMFADWGELIARTDRSVSKHAGLTAFLVPMDALGVEVRPIRQMSGGASFGEVFLDEVRLADGLRLGEVGEGWKVALTTLGFERASSGTSNGRVGGSPAQVVALAQWLGVASDPLVRQSLARLHAERLTRTWTAQRGGAGSVGKLQWTEELRRTSHVVSGLLGPRLTADTGEWGTFAWNAHVLGAPGYRIAGGSDEIQRNIIGERVLDLPREPR